MNFNEDVVHVLQMIGAPLPGGDSQQLNNLADGWNAMATDLDTQNNTLATAVSSVSPDQWQGDACSAFMKQWQSLHGAMTQGAENFRSVAKSLQGYAQTVDSINEQIVSIAEQIIAVTAAGAALSLVTLGGSDAAAAEADAVEGGRIMELIADFIKAAKATATDIKEFLGISDELASLIAEFGKNFGTNFAADFSSNVLSQGLSGNGISWGADFDDASVDALGSALLGSGLSKDLNPVISGAATNMFGTLLQDQFVDGDSLSATLENMAVSAGTGAAGGHLNSEGGGLAAAGPLQEIGTNTLLYTGGDIAENDVNGLGSRIGSIMNGLSTSGDQMPTVASPEESGIST